MPNPRRSPVSWLRTLVLGALAALLICAPSALATWPTFETAVPATFVASGMQNPTPQATFNGVSCASRGNCTAAGQFMDAAGDHQAFTQTMSSGTWGTAVPATFAGGIQNTNPDAMFKGVSCSSAGNCTAVGVFKNATFFYEAFTQTMTNGTWAAAQKANFANGVQYTNPNAEFDGVSCPSDGNCVAVGVFRNAAGDYPAFTQTMTNGTWGSPVPATFGAGIQNTQPNAQFSAVACSSAGNCTAAGRFRNAAGDREAFTQTMTNGTWATAVPATFANGVQAASPYTAFTSVSCSSAGNCTAAGQFSNVNNQPEAFTQTMTSGTWATARPAQFASGFQNANFPDAKFAGVSCPSDGNCVAVGQVRAGFTYPAFTQTMTNGTWATATPASFDSGVQASSPSAEFTSVSCSSAGNCTAAGDFSDVGGNQEAFTQTLVSGTWVMAVPAVFASGVQNVQPVAIFNAVSCSPDTNCTAGGQFLNTAGNPTVQPLVNAEAFTSSATAPPAPTPTPTPTPAPTPTPTPSPAPSPGASATAGTTPTSGSTPTAPRSGRFTARTRCGAGRCTTTGRVPRGAARITQTATSTASANSVAFGRSRARAIARTVTGTCTVHRPRSGSSARTYTCTLTLRAGTWTVNTTASSASGAVLARAGRRVRVGRVTPVTG